MRSMELLWNGTEWNGMEFHQIAMEMNYRVDYWVNCHETVTQKHTNILDKLFIIHHRPVK
jgi:hypothetical protein